MLLGDLDIKARMKHYNVPGLSVALVENGGLSRTHNYGLLKSDGHKKISDQTRFSACSISKFVTGMVILKLVDSGLLHLDDDVNNQLSSWKVPENEYTVHKKVTLRSLLSHQSGIKDPENSFPELRGNEFPSMVELLNGHTPYCKKAIEVKLQPESEFHYSDAGYCVIQLLIEDVTKKPFGQVVKELIFEPLNMENSSYPTVISETNGEFSCGHDRNGKVVEGDFPIYPYPAASGLWTTPSDLSKLITELFNALRGESKLGISQMSAKEMISPQGKPWTGLGLFLDRSGDELEISSLGWGVGFQCMLVAYPSKEKAAIIMTNAELGVHQLEGLIGEIYRSLQI